jgi:peptide/nickel transport system permease protein
LTGLASLLATRVAAGLLSLLLVACAVFVITGMLPGDVAQEDQPAWLRFLHWIGGLLTGNPGTSLVNNTPVAQLIGSRLPNSLLLAGITAAVSVPLALTIGIAAAMFQGSLFDRAVGVLSISVVSVPEFLVATAAVLIFAVKLRWLSALSYVSDIGTVQGFLRAFAMPVLTLCAVIMAQMVRMTRAAVIDQLGAPYVEMARLKGVGPVRVVLSHALPNAIGPIANAVALSLSYLLGGVIIVETIFNYPGIAKLMVDAVSTRDMPLVQACAMLFCAAYLVLVTAADLCAILSNPRLRHR